MPEQPKFYAGIVVHPEQATQVERAHTYLRMDPERLTGRLSGELVALQPLHVGSGALLPPEDLGLNAPDVPLVKAFARRGDLRTIPGSSLKGSFRSLVELFTPSCVCKTRSRQYRDCRYDSKRHIGELCPACKMFGAMGYQGQVRFEDAPQQKGDNALHLIPPQYKPVGKDYRRYYPHALIDDRDERSWPLEVVTAGSRFVLSAQFINLMEGELGLLLIALGQGKWALCPKIGAGKSSGLGAVQIEGLGVERWQIDRAYNVFESVDAWEPVDIGKCIQAARPLYASDVLDTLQRDLARAAIPEVRNAGND